MTLVNSVSVHFLREVTFLLKLTDINKAIQRNKGLCGENKDEIKTTGKDKDKAVISLSNEGEHNFM